MRKFSCFAMSFLLLVAVFCFASVALAKKKVVVWTHNHPQLVKAHKEYFIPSFEKENPDIEIEYLDLPFNELQTKLVSSLVTGTGPDLIGLFSIWLYDFAKKGFLESLDPTYWGAKSTEALADQYMGTGVRGLILDGKLYLLPNVVNLPQLWFNVDHFKESGLDPQNPPKTWKEVHSYAEKLVRFDEKGKMVRAGFQWTTKVANWYLHNYTDLLWQCGGSFYNEDFTKANLNTPEAVRALEIYRDLVKGVGGPNFGDNWPVDDISNGRVSMWQGPGTWLEETSKAINPKINLMSAPLPQVENGEEVAFIMSIGLSLNAESKVKPEALKYFKFSLDWKTNWEVQSILAYQKFLAQNKELMSNILVQNQITDLKRGRYLIVPSITRLTMIVSEMCERVLMAGMEPKKALEIANRALDRAVKKAGVK